MLLGSSYVSGRKPASVGIAVQRSSTGASLPAWHRQASMLVSNWWGTATSPRWRSWFVHRVQLD
ncbi:MAG: hypothetical protein H7A20_01725 [Rhodanobacteraceae bacterium]|nr:hypothetical protein [Rhodanobacteraceae bacterium]